jgi:p-aminobenzoyl-glutamate transporter AbgT
MSHSSEAAKTQTSKTVMQKILDTVERVGNSVPHPVLIFLILIAIVIVLSHILYLIGASVSFQVINPDTDKIETVTTAANSLMTGEGIRHIYTRFVPNFLGFSAVGLLIVAMIGVGVAEEAGLVNSLIRKLVVVSPAWALTYILAFVGILSSVASDAGYLVLIPLAGTALMSVRRHPLAGLALGFAGVASAFTVNEGVKLSPRLLAQYPEEMTIILQHQFWDLTVLEDRFEVGLSFGGIPERLVVPFNSIKSFFDPSVQFGLQFEANDAAAESPAANNLPAVPASAPTALTVPEPAAESQPEPARPSEGAEVVRLDRFRKK